MAKDSINVQHVQGPDGQVEYIVKMNKEQFGDFVNLIRSRKKIEETVSEIYARELIELPALGNC